MQRSSFLFVFMCLGLLMQASAQSRAGELSLGTRPSNSSSNIHLSGKITPTAEHPFAGLWKTKCNEDFGLAIAPAGPMTYSVSFCGPGGCFEPETYRPNTKLLEDTNYKISGPREISISGMGGSMSRYTKCWPVAN